MGKGTPNSVVNVLHAHKTYTAFARGDTQDGSSEQCSKKSHGREGLNYLQGAGKSPVTSFFKTFRACVLTLRNAPEWPMLKELLELSLCK